MPTSSAIALSSASQCHNTNKWKPSLFDHETTGFSLKGGHENVACGACHQLKKDVNGEQVLFYKPTPKACEACHSNGRAEVDDAGDQQTFLNRLSFEAGIPGLERRDLGTRAFHGATGAFDVLVVEAVEKHPRVSALIHSEA